MKNLNKKHIGFFFAFITFLTLVSQAQQTTTTMPLPQITATKAHQPLMLGVKSYNDTGRFGELKDDKNDSSKGRTYKGKHEVFLGYRHQSGWGAYGQITQYRYEYNNAELNKWSMSDPSLTLVHPDFYNSDGLRLSGSARAYIPYTDRTKAQNIRQYAYYFNFNYALADGAEVFNTFIPRWFAADTYKAADSRFYIEDRTIYTQKVGSWGRWGIGHWTQFEQHAETPVGLTVELIPQFDFLISPKAFIGPRISFPVYVQDTVYDAPAEATSKYIYAQIYFQATL